MPGVIADQFSGLGPGGGADLPVLQTRPNSVIAELRGAEGPIRTDPWSKNRKHRTINRLAFKATHAVCSRLNEV